MLAGVTAISVNSETGNVVIQLADRNLMFYDVTQDVLLPFCDVSGDEVQLPQTCTQMALCKLGGQVSYTVHGRSEISVVSKHNKCNLVVLSPSTTQY